MSRKWMDTAACRGVASHVFFPDDPPNWDEARNICRKCPHQKPCLLMALNFETPDVTRFGMWGGMTPDERERYVNSD